MNEIKIGDEIRTRWQTGAQVVGVVTYNTADDFCFITETGMTYHYTRAYVNPYKTGRHFDVDAFLQMIHVKK